MITLDQVSAQLRELDLLEGKTVTGAKAVRVRYRDQYFLVNHQFRELYGIGNLSQYTDVSSDDCQGIEFYMCESGRAWGKSWEIARCLILLADTETTNIFTGRETKDANDHSTKKYFEYWIDELNLSHRFDIQNNIIINKYTKTEIIFRGLQTYNASTIKGLAMFKYVWIDEAQYVSAHSYELLIPTIRTDNRVFFLSYNNERESDEVHSIKRRRKAKILKGCYLDNPFLPQTSYDEAEEDKELNFDKWRHIWMAEFLRDNSAKVILPYDQLKQCVDLHEEFGYDEGVFRGGFDIADRLDDKSDKNSLALRRGPVVHFVDRWRKEFVYQSVDHVHGFYNQYGFQTLHYDLIGVGVGAKSEYGRLEEELKKKGEVIPYTVNAFQGSGSALGGDSIFVKHTEDSLPITNKDYFLNAKAQQWWNLKLRLDNSIKLIKGKELDRPDYFLSFSSSIDNLEKIFLELSQATYENTGKLKVDKMPGVSEYVDEIDKKKKKKRSPNDADAIGYAFADDFKFGLRAKGDQVEQKPEPPRVRRVAIGKRF